MKKWGVLLSLWMISLSPFAATLPDNMYFNAMQDELKRSMAKLHRPGVEKPYFIAYKLEQVWEPYSVGASLGSLYPMMLRDSQLYAYVWVDIGNFKKSSVGHVHEDLYAQHAYRPRQAGDVAKSYGGIRQTLWRLTDKAYNFAAEVYQQKQAYKRTKQLDEEDKLPDVIPARQATYVEEIPSEPIYDLEQLQTWVKEQSALGKEYPFLEQFAVDITPTQRNSYYLNSRGGFYQTSFTALHVEWYAKMRDKDGYKREYKEDIWLNDFSDENKKGVANVIETFLSNLRQLYEAVPGEKYIGPVLIERSAAGNFIYDQLVANFQNLKGLSSSSEKGDSTRGSFDEVGQRVMAPGITVWDEPSYRESGGFPLGGFMPVDDEGIAAQELKLIENGRVVELPRTTRPLSDKQPSNGHARITHTSLPRERLTNVFIEADSPVTDEELKAKLLDRCRELGLEYGYILYAWPNESNNNTPVLQRIYLDGSGETVYGLNLAGLTTRSLRDILAVGDTRFITHIDSDEISSGIPSQSVDSPALLIDEMEFHLDGGTPDKKPFVAKP